MRYFNVLALIFLSIFIFQNCSSSSSGTEVCTDEFVMHSVTVLDSFGTPADSVDISIINKESGESYPCDEYLCTERETGSYIIMHDNFKDSLKEESEPVVVQGEKDGYYFNEEFEFSGGECHVKKVAGPDTVKLAEN